MQTTSRIIAVAIATCLSLVTVAWAQKPAAYPAKGQSAQAQSQDDAECLAWAKQTTGIDPAVAAAPPPPSGPRGERVGGAVRGAVVGEVVADDAKAGAAVGVLAGGRRARANQAAQSQQAQVNQQESLGRYYQAYGACMQGRGYTIN